MQANQKKAAGFEQRIARGPDGMLIMKYLNVDGACCSLHVFEGFVMNYL
jgi:hypothetical protein